MACFLLHTSHMPANIYNSAKYSCSVETSSAHICFIVVFFPVVSWCRKGRCCGLLSAYQGWKLVSATRRGCVTSQCRVQDVPVFCFCQYLAADKHQEPGWCMKRGVKNSCAGRGRILKTHHFIICNLRNDSNLTDMMFDFILW